MRETTDWLYFVLVLLRNRNCIKLHMYSRSEKSPNIIRYISSVIVKHYIGASGDHHRDYISIDDLFPKVSEPN